MDGTNIIEEDTSSIKVAEPLQAETNVSTPTDSIACCACCPYGSDNITNAVLNQSKLQMVTNRNSVLDKTAYSVLEGDVPLIRRASVTCACMSTRQTTNRKSCSPLYARNTPAYKINPSKTVYSSRSSNQAIVSGCSASQLVDIKFPTASLSKQRSSNPHSNMHPSTSLQLDSSAKDTEHSTEPTCNVIPLKPFLSSTVCPAPFSHEPAAIEINEACNYSLRITAEMAKANQAPRAVRVYADGAYDMFHSGHARQLMQAKCAFPNTYLIVGVSNDADLHKYKGRTVMNETERYEAVRHCRYVDEVVTDAPWSITTDFLQKHKIDFVAHDDIPYASADCEDIYKPLKEAGMFVATQRTEGISTTDVIGRIVRDYDVYLRRNIRRGLSRKDLNISYMKEKKLQFQDNFENMIKRGSSFIQNVDSKRREFVDHLEDISHDIVRSFMRIFGSDGRLRNWFSSRRSALTLSSTNIDFPSSISSRSSSEEPSTPDGLDNNLQSEAPIRTRNPNNRRCKRSWSVDVLDEMKHTQKDQVANAVSSEESSPRQSLTNEQENEQTESSDYSRSVRTRRSLNSYRSPGLPRKISKMNA